MAADAWEARRSLVIGFEATGDGVVRRMREAAGEIARDSVAP